jgi:energy-coupling factor transporter ATP-binding protein EcfA2
MTSFALKTHSLSKYYGFGSRQVRAVDKLTLGVPTGSIYGLLGRNSSGKTTTIRMALGLARPTEGSIEVFGMQPFVIPTVSSSCARLPMYPKTERCRNLHRGGCWKQTGHSIPTPGPTRSPARSSSVLNSRSTLPAQSSRSATRRRLRSSTPLRSARPY